RRSFGPKAPSLPTSSSRPWSRPAPRPSGHSPPMSTGEFRRPNSPTCRTPPRTERTHMHRLRTHHVFIGLLALAVARPLAAQTTQGDRPALSQPLTLDAAI